MILYLRKFSKQSLSIIQWAASFSSVCYHKVILQDATALSLSGTHFMVLMKTITCYNTLKTFTLIQNFNENPASLQVISQYCLNCSCPCRNSVILHQLTNSNFLMVSNNEGALVSLLSSFWIVLSCFPSFFPPGDPGHTVHSFEVSLQQLLFP